MNYTITTPTGTTVEHQRHEAVRRMTYLASVGVPATLSVGGAR